MKRPNTETPLLLFTAICLLIYLLCPKESLATYCAAPLYTHLTFHFQHANPFHLLANIATIRYFLSRLSPITPPHLLLVTASFPATLASFASTTPIIGASAIAFALIGFYLYAHLFGRLRFTSKRNKHRFLLTLIATLIIGFILPQMAGTVHLAALLLGLFTAPLAIQRQPHITLHSIIKQLLHHTKRE